MNIFVVTYFFTLHQSTGVLTFEELYLYSLQDDDAYFYLKILQH